MTFDGDNDAGHMHFLIDHNNEQEQARALDILKGRFARDAYAITISEDPDTHEPVVAVMFNANEHEDAALLIRRMRRAARNTSEMAALLTDVCENSIGILIDSLIAQLEEEREKSDDD